MPGMHIYGTRRGTDTFTEDDLENDGETILLGRDCRGIDFKDTSGNAATIVFAGKTLEVDADGRWAGPDEVSFNQVVITGSTAFKLIGLV